MVLADSVWTWEDASALGEEAFARQVQATERGRRGGREGGRWGGAGAQGWSGGGTAAGARTGAPGTFGGSANGGPGTSRQPVPSGIAPGLSGAVAGSGVAQAGGAARGAGGNGHAPNGMGNGSTGAGNGHGRMVQRVIPHVSPLRGGGVLGELVVDMAADAGAAGPRGGGAPARPGSDSGAGPAPAVMTGRGQSSSGGAGSPAAGMPGSSALRPETDDSMAWSDDEPPLPMEAERAVARQAAAPTQPLEAAGATLHLRFGSLSGERLGEAFAAVRELLRSRPGQTSVVLDVPLGDGRTQPMELRTRVAYDAELLAELGRRFGGAVTPELSPG